MALTGSDPLQKRTHWPKVDLEKKSFWLYAVFFSGHSPSTTDINVVSLQTKKMEWTVMFPVHQSMDSTDHFCRCLQASDPPAVVMSFSRVFLPPSGSLKTHLWDMPTSLWFSKCMPLWLSLSDKLDTPQKQLSNACLRPNLSPRCKYVISMNKGRFQTGFARRSTVTCFLSPAPLLVFSAHR